MKKNYWIVVILIMAIGMPVKAQVDEDVTDGMKGMLPTNYMALEAAFTPGMSFSAGADVFFDVLKMAGKKSAPSWVITGQYYAYTMPARTEKWNYWYGHNFGLRGGGYKFGTGIIVYEKTSSMRFRFYYDSRSGDDGNQKTSRLYRGPVSKSFGIFIYYLTENSGTSWVLGTLYKKGNYRITNKNDDYLDNKNYNHYIIPTLKIQKAWNFLKKSINPDGQKGWRYFDIGLPFTPDFKQYGIRCEWFMLAGFWTSRLSLGAIYRTEVPEDPDINRKQLLHWYFPITVTLGIGNNIFRKKEGDMRFNDKKRGGSML
ncbi:MAG: hypothetical protein HY958_13505 [Bacteroidia bacterium]|nr:hypothetical protein [Bacteroidia bacterium]